MDGSTQILILTLNGEPRTFAAPLTVSGLVDALGLDAAVVLQDGDVLEIVHFIGGG
jgi:sulfur carrier protein ThiS